MLTICPLGPSMGSHSKRWEVLRSRSIRLLQSACILVFDMPKYASLLRDLRQGLNCIGVEIVENYIKS